ARTGRRPGAHEDLSRDRNSGARCGRRRGGRPGGVPRVEPRQVGAEWRSGSMEAPDPPDPPFFHSSTPPLFHSPASIRTALTDHHSRNLTRKLLAGHLVSGRLEPGEEIGLRVDQALLQDATGTMACLQLEQLGRMPGEPARAGTALLPVTDQF